MTTVMAALASERTVRDALAKSERARMTTAMKEMHQYDIKVELLEKEKRSHVYSKHSDFYKQFSQLEDIDNKMTADRLAERVVISRQLKTVKTMMKRFHRELEDVKATEDFLAKLKIIMEEIECYITCFKDQQRKEYESLMREERITFLEVSALEKRFDSWSHQRAAPVASRKTSAGRPRPEVTNDLLPEVADFERFLKQTGGTRGGWDEYDHGTFMKFINRHKGKVCVYKEMMAGLPTKSADDLQRHCAWYDEFILLNERKKEAIYRWRQRKQTEKEMLAEHAEEEDDEEEEEERRRMRDQHAAEERHVKMAQLNRWKVEKELERATEEERKLKVEFEESKQTALHRQNQLQVKRQVDVYRCEKRLVEEERLHQRALRAQEETARRQAAGGDIERFRQRDMAALNRKMAVERAKAESEKEAEERLLRLTNQVRVSVARDPSRLLRPTAGWVARQRDTTPVNGGQVLHMPHRAVPTWRQNVL